ncbi:hypothetical protein RB653_007704 [Dictyostelium firmibasis]|uniref:Uncharacterized protein n=1 Tax=Dictyostelium firmibasis TaxID=79012 RepID=A0AAN7YY15_9MYCE
MFENFKKIQSYIVYDLYDNNKVRDFVDSLKEEELDNYIIYQFEVDDAILLQLEKEELELIQLVQEQYIDKKDFSLLNDNHLWIKYQDQDFIVNEIKKPETNNNNNNFYLNCFSIKGADNEIKKELNLKVDETITYASFSITRYHFKMPQKVDLYIDCVVNYQLNDDENNKFSLFGHVKCQAKDYNELLLFYILYNQPKPLKPNIINYLSSLKNNNIINNEDDKKNPINLIKSPISNETILSTPKILDIDPLLKKYQKVEKPSSSFCSIN